MGRPKGSALFAACPIHGTPVLCDAAVSQLSTLRSHTRSLHHDIRLLLALSPLRLGDSHHRLLLLSLLHPLVVVVGWRRIVPNILLHSTCMPKAVGCACQKQPLFAVPTTGSVPPLAFSSVGLLHDMMTPSDLSVCT